MISSGKPLEEPKLGASSLEEVAKAAAAGFNLHGAEKNLQVVHPPGGHDFPEAAREQAYRLPGEELR